MAPSRATDSAISSDAVDSGDAHDAPPLKESKGLPPPLPSLVPV